MNGFLATYGVNPMIVHSPCGRSTEVVVPPNRDVMAAVCHYKATHVCGPADGPWDIEDPEPVG